MERPGSGTKFTIDRKLFSSDIWFASPWKLKIWIYLLGNANYKDTVWMGIPLRRGQLIRSYRKIARDCAYKIGYRTKKPSLSTVREICEDLTKELRIEQRSVHQGTIFTICNYNGLQPFGEHEAYRLPNSDRTVTEQDNKRRKKEVLKKELYIVGNFWNSKGIIRHGPKTIENSLPVLKKHLLAPFGRGDWWTDDICRAICNYEQVLNGDDYFWTHRWTLKEFLTRGLDRFVDDAKPLENFLKEGTKDEYAGLRARIEASRSEV